MDRWEGKTAVVTGASAGIGAAIALSLANAGVEVVGLARRTHLVDKLRARITGKGHIFSRRCDVSELKDITSAFEWIEHNLDGIDLMVNNAGVFYKGAITEAGSNTLTDNQIMSIIDTNYRAMVFCSRRAIASMKSREVDGHIINISSVTGHYIPYATEFNVYPSTKHAVRAFTMSLANEMSNFKCKIKTTCLSPGLVQTAMASEAAMVFPSLQPQDVADAVLYLVSTPPHVNITELTLGPICEKRL